MKKLFTILFLLVVVAGFSQPGRTYDTVYATQFGSLPANLRITETSFWNNVTRPKTGLLVYFTGLGEVGANNPAVDTPKMRNFGPHKYHYQTGWTPAATIATGTIEFTLATVQFNNTYPSPLQYKRVLDSLVRRYNVDTNSIVLSGWSHGGWVADMFICYKNTSGDSTYPRFPTGIINMQGVVATDTKDATTSYPGRFQMFARVPGTKYFAFEQTGDGSRDHATVVNTINAISPGKAQLVTTSHGGGGHGKTEYYWGDGSMAPGVYPMFGVSQTVYQLAVRMMDTVLLLRTAGPPNVSAGPPQTITYPGATSVTMAGSSSANGVGNSISLNTWSKLSGPSATITNTHSLTTTITGLTIGTYGFQLAATDNNALTSNSTVTITVDPLPEIPQNTAFLGSSSAWGYGVGGSNNGGTLGDSSYRQQFTEHYRGNTLDTVWNLSEISTNLFAAMPTWWNTVNPWGSLFAANPLKNVNAAMAKSGVQAVVVAFPTNNYDAMTVAQVMFGFRTIKSYLDSSGKKYAIVGTTPRGNLSPTEHARLLEIDDSLRIQAGSHYVHIYDSLAKSHRSWYMNPAYILYPADSVHWGVLGHNIIYRQLLSHNLFGEAPIARAGNDVTITYPITSVRLDFTGSTGSNISYRCRQISGPAGVMIQDSTSATPGLAYLMKDNTYGFEVTVSDGSGNTAKDTTLVTVAHGPYPPSFGPGVTGNHKVTAATLAADRVYCPSASIGDYIIRGANHEPFGGSNTQFDIYPTWVADTFSMEGGDTIWIAGGTYNRIYMEMPVGLMRGDSLNPVVITGYGTQPIITNFGFTLKNFRAVVVDGIFGGQTYGIQSLNYFMSPSVSQGLTIESDSMQLTEIKGVKSGLGHFAAMVLKKNGATGWYRNTHIHHCRFYHPHGEGLYSGSTGEDPQNKFEDYELNDCVFEYCGNEAIQIGQIYGRLNMHNNVVVFGAANRYSAFMDEQSFCVQIAQRDNGMKMRDNIFIGSGDQLINILKNKPSGYTLVGGTDSILNNAFLNAGGAAAIYVGGQNTIGGTLVVDSNVSGRHNFFADKVFTDARATNTKEWIRKGEFSGGYPLNFTIRYNSLDTNKYTLPAGATASGNTIVNAIPFPQFTYSSWPVADTPSYVFNAVRWVNTIFSTNGDEYTSLPATKKGQQVTFNTGDYVFHLGYLYKSKHDGNASNMPIQNTTDSHWTCLGVLPEGDYTLPANDFYRLRHIGLSTAPSTARRVPVIYGKMKH